ncbi:uncharacterized protein METZ01_LOCUS219420 [marine metagenome]|uniref:Uncharacterized protein n=1 Tax=marine metagenome TaxID=408172 RepID=A0A382FU04_9ZZZZ
MLQVVGSIFTGQTKLYFDGSKTESVSS